MTVPLVEGESQVPDVAAEDLEAVVVSGGARPAHLLDSTYKPKRYV